MATKTYVLKQGRKPTNKELEEVRRAAKRPIQFDEDSPEFTEEQLLQFHRVGDARKENDRKNRKQSITLRLSPRAAQKARSLGKGYTSILAGILESALNDPAYLSRITSK